VWHDLAAARASAVGLDPAARALRVHVSRQLAAVAPWQQVGSSFIHPETRYPKVNKV
jgi:hypothetical protein